MSVFTPLGRGNGVAGVIIDGDTLTVSIGNNYVGIGWLPSCDVWSTWRLRRGEGGRGEERGEGGGERGEGGRREGRVGEEKKRWDNSGPKSKSYVVFVWFPTHQSQTQTYHPDKELFPANMYTRPPTEQR